MQCRWLATIYSFDFCQKTSHVYWQSKARMRRLVLANYYKIMLKINAVIVLQNKGRTSHA